MDDDTDDGRVGDVLPFSSSRQVTHFTADTLQLLRV